MAAIARPGNGPSVPSSFTPGQAKHQAAASLGSRTSATNSAATIRVDSIASGQSPQSISHGLLSNQHHVSPQAGAQAVARLSFSAASSVSSLNGIGIAPYRENAQQVTVCDGDITTACDITPLKPSTRGSLLPDVAPVGHTVHAVARQPADAGQPAADDPRHNGPPFTRMPSWLAACSDLLVPPWCISTDPSDTSLVLPSTHLPSSCDARMVSLLRMWCVGKLMGANVGTCLVPWLLVRLHSRQAGIDGLGSDDYKFLVEDPSGRIACIVEGGVADRWGLPAPGDVLLLERVPLCKSPGKQPWLFITRDNVFRVYRSKR